MSSLRKLELRRWSKAIYWGVIFGMLAQSACAPIETPIVEKTEQSQATATLVPDEITINNLSCDLPKEIDRTSEHKESDFDFKAFGSDGMNRFW